MVTDQWNAADALNAAAAMTRAVPVIVPEPR